MQRVVAESQDSECGLHAVAEGAGAAVPGEPWAQLTEVLETQTEQIKTKKQISLLSEEDERLTIRYAKDGSF